MNTVHDTVPPKRLVLAGDTVQLAVEFRHQADRFTHQLVVVGREGCVASSVDESPLGPNWPLSPVLQEVENCRLAGDRDSLLAVGMTSAAHWSVAVDVDRGMRAIVFDVACRVKSAAAFLGSTYQVTCAELAADAQEIRTKTGVVIQLVTGRLEQSAPDRALVYPETYETNALPATARWKYLFRLPGGDG